MILGTLVFSSSSMLVIGGISQFLGPLSFKRFCLGASQLLLFGLQFYFFSFVTYGLYQAPIIFMGYVPLCIAFATCLYLTFRETVNEKGTSISDLCHLIPTGTGLAVYLYFQQMDTDTLLTLIGHLYDNSHLFDYLPETALSGLFSLMYLGLSLRVNKAYTGFNLKDRQSWTGIMLIGLSLFIGLVLASTHSIHLTMRLINFGLVAVSVGVISGYILHIRYPGRLESLITSIVSSSYKKRNYISEINIEETKSNLLALLENEKIYRDPMMTLNGLAKQLGVSRYQLSQLLNETLDTSFHKFISDYRVTESKELLKKDENQTVASIAYQVGFNSLSSFQKAFKSATNKTPTQYKKLVKLSHVTD